MKIFVSVVSSLLMFLDYTPLPLLWQEDPREGFSLFLKTEWWWRQRLTESIYSLTQAQKHGGSQLFFTFEICCF